MKEPFWLPLDVVLAIHEKQLAEHGGISGIRDENLLLSALERPPNLYHYATPSIAELASAYSFGIVKNHPFLDGNKRTGFLAAYVFLAINKHKFETSQPEVVTAITALAAGNITEKSLAKWIAEHTTKR